jgi:hypothetical protein
MLPCQLPAPPFSDAMPESSASTSTGVAAAGAPEEVKVITLRHVRDFATSRKVTELSFPGHVDVLASLPRSGAT